jgi:hypothetical protein
MQKNEQPGSSGLLEVRYSGFAFRDRQALTVKLPTSRGFCGWQFKKKAFRKAFFSFENFQIVELVVTPAAIQPWLP